MDKWLEGVKALIEDERKVAVNDVLTVLNRKMLLLKNKRHILQDGVMYISESDVLSVLADMEIKEETK